MVGLGQSPKPEPARQVGGGVTVCAEDWVFLLWRLKRVNSSLWQQPGHISQRVRESSQMMKTKSCLDP